MKKIISVTLSLLILSALCSLSVFAESGSAITVYVTIGDKDGKLAVAYEPISVTDTDGDGALTVSDALFAAHEAKYEGGAASGYKAEVGSYGLSLAKLWGCANGGSYGYYVNDTMAWSLADEVKEGDHVHAYIYTDLSYYSDKFSYFDKKSAELTAGDEIELTLTGIGFDDNYNTVSLPIAGASITVNGNKTSFVTGDDGKVKIALETAGDTVISATSDTETLVAPVCRVTVSEKAAAPADTTATPDETSPVTESAPTGDPIVFLAITSALSLLTLLAVAARKKVNEK